MKQFTCASIAAFLYILVVLYFVQQGTNPLAIVSALLAPLLILPAAFALFLLYRLACALYGWWLVARSGFHDVTG